MIRFDVTLTPQERERLRATDPEAWFTSVAFGEDESPTHPHAGTTLEENNEFKQAAVSGWIEKVAPGASVLDAFCANGAFSFLAAQSGASSVVGFDFEQRRVDMANLTAELVGAHQRPLPVTFERLDAYDLGRHYHGQQFDVSMALGGLYHVADPPHVLRQLRSVTSKWLVVQTTHIIEEDGNRARFEVRRDRTDEGLSSIRGGYGVWHYTVECFQSILQHGGFRVVDDFRPPKKQRKRFPWYAALVEVIEH